MTEIELQQVPEERATTSIFLGKDRHRRAAGTAGASSTSMADCLNMASEEYPCAFVRRQRVETYCEYHKKGDESFYANGAECRYAPAKILDATMHGDDIAYLLADGSVMCGNRRWERWPGGGHEVKVGRIYSYGHGLFVPATNMYIPDVFDDGFRVIEDVDVTAYWAIWPTDVNGTDIAWGSSFPASPQNGDLFYLTVATQASEIGLYRAEANYDEGAYVNWLKEEHVYNKIYPVRGSGDVMEWLIACAYLFKLNNGDILHVLEQDTTGGIDETFRVESVIIDMEEGIRDGIIVQWTHAPVDSVKLNINRLAPVIDHAVIHDNRVWACRYGKAATGVFVNEIYASKQGNPLNFASLKGTAEDSFTAGVGEEGDWTGAAMIGDNVVFFKENCFYIVYGDAPDNYRVSVTYAPGIAKGSEKSAVNINGALYYLSPVGIMRMNAGSMPGLISDDLMFKNVLQNAIGGTDGRKYYLQAKYVGAGTKIVVYDTLLGEWHIEEQVEQAVSFVPFENELLAVACKDIKTEQRQYAYYEVQNIFISPPGAVVMTPGKIPLCFIDPRTELLIYPSNSTFYPGNYEDHLRREIDYEYAVNWSFETGDFGHELPDYKRVKSISVRAWLDKIASMSIEIMYDEDGEWHALEGSDTIKADHTGTTRIEYRLRRCDLFRLRFSGRGSVCIYSITHTYETAGDRSYGTY